MQEKLSKLKYKFKTEVKSGSQVYAVCGRAGGDTLYCSFKGRRERAVADTDNCTAGLYRQCRQYRTGGACRRRGKAFLVELEVSPRQYDAQQIEGIFDTVYEQILQEMVSSNESLSCVRQNLKLVTESQDYPVTAEWYSEDTAVIDTDGTVYNTEFEPGQKETVRLVLILKYGEYRCEYPIEAVVWEHSMIRQNKSRQEL